MIEQRRAVERNGLRSAVVVVGPGTSTAGVGRLLTDLGVANTIIDASMEDPFGDIDQVVTSVDAAGADVVMCVAARSVTAKAVAVLCDLPLAVTPTIDARRLQAIDDALVVGSEMHSGVIDVRLDGVRRLGYGDIELNDSRPFEATARVIQDRRAIEGHAHLRVGVERPGSGRLVIRADRTAPISADDILVESRSGRGRVSMGGREQRFQRLTGTLHHKPLRELVIGVSPHRRPVADTAPL